MSEGSVTRIRAVHPDWSGYLLLSAADHSLVHEGYRNKATYDLSGGTLSVHWEKYDAETFVALGGTYVHTGLLRNLPKLDRLFAVSIRDHPVLATRLSVEVPGTRYDVSLRLNTSDIPTFDQVFVQRQYDSRELPSAAGTIVDLGANIGLSTVFFGLKYPDARVLAVEPDADNFAAMTANTRALGHRARLLRAAVWSHDGVVELRTEDADGTSLGAWGVRVSDQTGKAKHAARCHTLPTLLDHAGFDTVDILKVDIEGAEREVFSRGAAAWLERVNLIVIETHDRFEPGSDAAVRDALGSRFDELPPSGENLLFRRRTG